MNSRIDNSFFHQNLKGIKVLAFVPHEDDEINTCGAFLKTLSSCGADIRLVFTTNGDWKYPAATRMKEAADSAIILGVEKDHIIFLGYGDSINNDKRDHLFYAVNEPTKSTAGHTETYGTNHYTDYAYLKNGKHRPYIRSSFLEDIISVIIEVKADIIICTDFDEHPDHRMLSLLLDEAIGIIRKQNPDYCPEIWKRFAYSLAYTAIPDYSCINNPETQRPDSGKTEKYALDIIDKSIYSWNNRIRIPVLCNEHETIRNNFIAQALKKHKSQRIITRADRIVNSDEVYWRRRTDNISLLASINVSSGNAEYLNDFILINTDDIDSVNPAFVHYYWQPAKNDKEKKAEFSWDQPQHIEQAVLYSSIISDSQVHEIIIRLNDGFEYFVKDIPNDGTPYSILLGQHDNITKCEIIITSAEGDHYGLSECEFYSSSKLNSHISPFCKILANDNFIYEYNIDKELESVSLDTYLFDITCEKPVFDIIQGKSTIKDNRLFLHPDDQEIIVKCKCPQIDAWDQIVIKRLSKQELAERMKDVAADIQFLQKERRNLKVHNMLYILRKQGPYSVIKRTVKNAVLPRLRKQNHGR